MPHVIVKLWPGKSERQKARLAEEIVKDVMNVLNYGEESVSVAIEEIKPQDWADKVYNPTIPSGSSAIRKLSRNGLRRRQWRFPPSRLLARSQFVLAHDFRVVRGEPFLVPGFPARCLTVLSSYAQVTFRIEITPIPTRSRLDA